MGIDGADVPATGAGSSFAQGHFSCLGPKWREGGVGGGEDGEAQTSSYIPIRDSARPEQNMLIRPWHRGVTRLAFLSRRFSKP